MKIDIEKWKKEYERNYEADVRRAGAKYPIFISNSGEEIVDRSPYFETVSKLYQKRGYLHWEEFNSIGLWKTRRQKKRYAHEFNKNNTERITRNAMQASDEEGKIKSLRLLKGVGIPVCSAILTIVYPSEYCIIDYRAWRALKWYLNSVDFSSYEDYSRFLDSYDSRTSVESYLTYLKQSREIGKEWNMTPRMVEMALWKYDEMKGKEMA